MHRRTQKEPILMRFYNQLFWEFAEFVNLRNNEVGFQLCRGPLCPSKKCLGDMQQTEQNVLECRLCGFKVEIDRTSDDLSGLARLKFDAELRKKYKVLDLDKLPTINEELKEEDKFYRVSVERDSDNLKDVHIIIGRRSNGGKKAHIIVSEAGEIRIDKKDLKPEEEVKSITSIIYK